jgi:hypothetical protein
MKLTLRHVVLLVALSWAIGPQAQFLREDTASQAVIIGPFLDPADGTAEGGLTIDAADVRLSKAGGNIVAKNSGACAHDELGGYTCTFDATDTSTPGLLQVLVCETGAVCVRQTFQVLAENVYDAWFAASATAGTDLAAVLVDTSTTLDDFLDTEVAAILSDTNAILVDTSTTLDDLIDTEIGTIVTAVGTTIPAAVTAVDDFVDTEIADIRRAIGPATTTIATLASQTSFTLTAGSADDNAYNGFALNVIDQSTATQIEVGVVSDYTGATKTVTLAADPGVYTIATGDNVVLLPAFLTTGVDVLTIEGADATDQLDAHAAAGLDAAGTRAALGLSSANLDTQLSAIDDYVDTEVAAILVDTGTTLDDLIDTEIAAILSNTDAILIDTSTTLDDFIDTEVAAILAAVDTETAAILADTDEVQTTLAAGGTIESLVDDLPAITTAVDTEVASILAAVDTEIGDLPTNAELATSQAAADDATLAAIAAVQALLDGLEDGSGTLLGCSFAIDSTPAAEGFYVNVTGCVEP